LGVVVTCLAIVAAVFVLGLFVVFLGIPWLVVLFVGWASFLRRLAQEWAWSPGLWWWVAGSLVLFLALYGFARSRRGLAPGEGKFRKAMTLLALSCCSLVAGLSSALATRLAWDLVQSPEPLMQANSQWVPGTRQHFLVRKYEYAARAAHMTALHQPTMAAWQRAWVSLGDDGESPVETCATRVVTNAAGQIVQVFVWPRDGAIFRELGYWTVKSDGVPSRERGDKLEAEVARAASR
jgi:hypothetical protein